MDFTELKAFIIQVQWGYLATTDGQVVGVRPMAGLAWNNNQLWCASAAKADKITQLKKVPHAEYCFCNPTGRHIRIAGPCTISTNNTEKLWLYKVVPALKEHISDPTSSDYVVIKMTPDNVRVMETDFTYSRVEIP
jgi:uncharacterized pyridoxamine 5'-phosphate oxidase family protein